MQGFKPKEQRQPQDGNMGRDAVMSAIARQAAQAQQQPQLPATESAPMRAMRQVFSGSIFDRRKVAEDQERRATGYANGGMVRGPGTGTSDSIPAEIPEGSYIMPADSTAQLGEEALSSMGRGFKPGRKKVPVNLSNGEYQLPPEQVHAVGVEALNQVKNATHQPANSGARGLQPAEAEPRLFFADGGVVTDEERRARLSQGLTPYAPNYGPAGLNPQARINAQAAAPTPAAKDPLDGGAVFGMFPQLAGGKRTTYAMDNKLRTGVQATGPSTFAQATPSEKTIIGGGDGRRMNAEQDPRSLTAVVPSGPAAPAPQTSAAPAAQTSLAGDAYMPGADANARPMFDTPAAPASNQVMPGVYQHGRGQYSDNPAGMGFAPGAGNPSANNIAAADALASRSAADVAGLVAAQDARGFQPQQAPQVRHSGNDWQARNDLRNLEVSAKSITNNGGRFDQTKGRNPAQAAYLSALQADAAARGAQPGLDAVAMRENAGIQREGMQQDGATTRTGMTEQGANAREQGRNILARDEFNLKKEASGFQTRAAQQQEQLRNVLLDPKSTPEQRAVAQRSLAALSGKTAADRMQTVTLPDTTNEMGQVVRGGQALVRVLEDGTVQQVPIGTTPAPQALPPKDQLKTGQTYSTSRGPARWDGKQFIPV